MLQGIDHLVIAVNDPDAAVAALATHLGIPEGSSGGRHPAWGTRNRLLWLGDTFIELVTVDDAALATRSWLGRPALRGLPDGPKAIGWAVATDDLDGDRSEMNASGATLDRPVAGERRRPDGRLVRWRLALPPEVSLEHPFLIEHDTSAAEWTPEDRAIRAALPARVLGMELPVETITGLPTGGGEVALGSQRVRAAANTVGMPVIRIGGLGRGRAEADLLGCRWILD